MDNEIFYRLIANPRRLKKTNNYNNIDDELLNIIKKKYDNYDITNECFQKIKSSENVLINNEINLIVDDIVCNVNINNNE